MNGFFKRLIVIGLFFLSNALTAQDLNQSIQSLEKDFRSFNYKKVIEKGQFLLADPYTSKEDSLLIYNYILSSAYAINDTVLAKKVVLDILTCEPSFAPDPRETSPKIIEFFNYVKKQNRPLVSIKRDTVYLPAKTTHVEPPLIKPLSIISGALLPGSGHLLEGFNPRGYVLSSISLVLLAGTIYAGIETNNRYETYMAATGSANYDRLYNDYNQIYK
ncbi:MAG TPA: hypothetical protein EYP36_01020, partial [Calditrichaeota bacterium]|nr:hypothetical protein [Calditrichota bacterium]